MEKHFQYQESEVYYTITGKGFPVVMLHGFAEDSSAWKEQVAVLEPYCQLIIPDLPGSGKSELLKKDTVAIEDFAVLLRELLNHENIDKGLILGHSMGGYITLAFAEMYPDVIAGFGLVHSTAFADSEEKKASRQKGIKLIEDYGAYSFIKNTTPNLFADNFKKEHADQVSALIEQGKNFSETALVHYYTAIGSRPDRTSVLQAAKVPVLFIIGTEDVAAPMEDLLKQVHLPKVSYIHIINGVGHMGMMENPKEVNKNLLQFIKDCSK